MKNFGCTPAQKNRVCIIELLMIETKNSVQNTLFEESLDNGKLKIRIMFTFQLTHFHEHMYLTCTYQM